MRSGARDVAPAAVAASVRGPCRSSTGMAEEVVRAAVGRHDSQLAGDLEHVEQGGGLLEDREVGSAAADHPDERALRLSHGAPGPAGRPATPTTPRLARRAPTERDGLS